MAKQATPRAALARLFVYGTLIDPELRRSLLGRAGATVAAVLEGYEHRGGRYPYLVRMPGRSVAGAVLSGLAPADLAALDDYEAVSPSLMEGRMRRLYVRELRRVVTHDGTPVVCWLYLPNLRDWPREWR